MADTFELIFQGDQELLAYFSSVSKPKKQIALMGPGQTAASGIIQGTLKRHAPRLTGLLKRSIGIKRYSTASSGAGAIISVIGPRSSIKISRAEYIRNLRKGKKNKDRKSASFIIPEMQEPSRYAARAEDRHKYTLGAALTAKTPAVQAFNTVTGKKIAKDFKKSTAGKRRSKVR